MTKRNPKITAIDLFCGAGGLTYGLRQGGIKVAAGFDLDPTCQFAFEHNNEGSRFFLKNVCDITGDHLVNLWGDSKVRLLAGCAPCQPFSTYSQGRSHVSDSRWRLLDEFSRLVGDTLPDFVTMENVPSLKKTEVFSEFLRTLKELNYDVWSGVLNCKLVGLPQNRHRLVLLASLRGAVPRLELNNNHSITIGDVLKSLPALTAGEVSEDDPLHRCASLSKLNIKRIRASLPGGNWRDWPKVLRAACHDRITGDGYLAVYGRMSEDSHAPTITTQCYNYGSGRFGHPTQDRAISLREAAILQGFPANYQFEPKATRFATRDIARLIGNAVPPPIGRVLAKAILKNI